MHLFRDNEVLLPTEYDVIAISPLGGVLHRFCWRNLKERPQFHNHGLLTHFAYLLPFRSYSKCSFGWKLPFATNFKGVFRVINPEFHNYTVLIPLRVFLTPYRVFRLPPTAQRIRTNFVRVGDIKLCLWRRAEVLCFSTTMADAINTAKPCRAACYMWLDYYHKSCLRRLLCAYPRLSIHTHSDMKTTAR